MFSVTGFCGTGGIRSLVSELRDSAGYPRPRSIAQSMSSNGVKASYAAQPFKWGSVDGDDEA